MGVKELIYVTLAVWLPVAAVLIAEIVYAGISSLPFVFVVLLVGIPVWSKVVNNWVSQSREQNLSAQISELSKRLEKIERLLEE